MYIVHSLCNFMSQICPATLVGSNHMVDRVSGLLPIVNLNIVEQHNKKTPISDICISRPIFLARAKTIATQYCSEVTFLLSALRPLDLYCENKYFKYDLSK